MDSYFFLYRNSRLCDFKIVLSQQKVNYLKVARQLNSETIMEKAIVLLKRFIRGFVAGFVASAVAVVVPNIQTINDFGSWLFALTIAGAVGGVTGGLLALDKAIRWKE